MLNKFKMIFFTFIILTISNVSAENPFNIQSNNFLGEPSKPLLMDDAFKVIKEIDENKNYINIIFDIAKHHYLYSDKINVTVNGFKWDNYNAPIKKIDDKFFGETNIIEDAFAIRLNNLNEINTIKIEYQGCSPKFNLCYPQNTLEYTINNIEINDSNSFYNESEKETSGTWYNNIINDSNQITKFGLFLLIGVLISFTPCVLPMIPILTSIIIGQKITSKTKALYMSSMYVVGTAIAYGSIGALSALSVLGIQSYIQNPYFIILGASLLFLLSLTLFDVFQLNFFNNSNNKLNEIISKIKINYFTITIIGFLSALIVSPCVAAPLASILLYTSTTGNPILSFFYVFTFGIGAGLTLIIVATSLNKIKFKSGRYMDFIKYLMGLLLIIVSIYLISRFINNSLIINSLYSFSVILFVAYVVKSLNLNNKNLITFIIFSGLLNFLILHFLGENYDHKNETTESRYKIINDINDIPDNENVFIKVYADWCIYCQNLEQNLFRDADIISLQEGYTLMTLDITNMNSSKQEIMKSFDIISAPAVITIKNNDGYQVESYNGQINKEELIRMLN